MVPLITPLIICTIMPYIMGPLIGSLMVSIMGTIMYPIMDTFCCRYLINIMICLYGDEQDLGGVVLVFIRTIIRSPLMVSF